MIIEKCTEIYTICPIWSVPDAEKNNPYIPIPEYPDIWQHGTPVDCRECLWGDTNGCDIGVKIINDCKSTWKMIVGYKYIDLNFDIKKEFLPRLKLWNIKYFENLEDAYTALKEFEKIRSLPQEQRQQAYDDWCKLRNKGNYTLKQIDHNKYEIVLKEQQ